MAQSPRPLGHDAIDPRQSGRNAGADPPRTRNHCRARPFAMHPFEETKAMPQSRSRRLSLAVLGILAGSALASCATHEVETAPPPPPPQAQMESQQSTTTATEQREESRSSSMSGGASSGGAAPAATPGPDGKPAIDNHRHRAAR